MRNAIQRPQWVWVVAPLLLTLAVVAACDRREVPLAQKSEPPTPTSIDSSPSLGVEIPSSEPMVRVKIRHILAPAQVTVSPTKGALKVVSPGASTTHVDTALRVSRHYGRWLGVPLSVAESDVIEIHSDHPISVSQSTGKVRQYHGSIRLFAAKDAEPPNSFLVINDVLMEDYIPGVLAGELYEGWHDAAFEAQAIAARAFAVSECQHRRHHAWDVTDTQASQAYVGIPSWPQAGQCAKRTRGLLLVWRAHVIPGYFSSCCGGRAALASEAIGPNPINSIPPLDGHGSPGHCQSSPMYHWTHAWNAESLRHALQKWGQAHKNEMLASLDRITSIQAVSPNVHGRPTTLEIHTTGATAKMACIDFPQALAQGGLDVPRSGWLDGSVDAGDLHVQGHGFGHGVGLCQYGAEAMAASGASAQAIIRFYYPGVEVQRAW